MKTLSDSAFSSQNQITQGDFHETQFKPLVTFWRGGIRCSTCVRLRRRLCLGATGCTSHTGGCGNTQLYCDLRNIHAEHNRW